MECRAAVLHCGNFMIRCTLVKSQNCHQGTGSGDWGQQRRQKWLWEKRIERCRPDQTCRRWWTINVVNYLGWACKKNLLTHFPPLRIGLKILHSKFRTLSNIGYMTNLRTIDIWRCPSHHHINIWVSGYRHWMLAIQNIVFVRDQLIWQNEEYLYWH